MTVNLIDLIKFDFNVTDIKLNELALDYTSCDKCKLMQLLDNYAVFTLENLNASIGFEYQYISDPPILGDIGKFTFTLGNTTLSLNSSTFFDDKVNAF